MPAAQSADKILARARQAAKAADWVLAQELYQGVLDRFPANKRARQGLEALRPALPQLLTAAQAAQGAGEWAKAERTLAAAAALAPDQPAIGLALAGCRFEMGRAPAALQAAQDILDRNPDHPEALNAKGRALREMGRGADAETCLRAALGHAATDAQTLNALGTLAQARGDRDSAAEQYRRAIALRPDDPVLHRNLAQVTTYAPGATHLDEMRALLARFAPGDPAGAPLHFALFKALDDLDDRAAAYSHLEQGNRLTKSALGYEFKSDALPYALSKALFKAPVAPLQVAPAQPRPVFVTGLPRTGTTLAERILARAEGTQPCGELTVVQAAVGRLLRALMARDDKGLSGADLQALRDEILQGLSAYSDGSPVLIDKMPLNFRWIGYICAALPEARIVHLSRAPVAVAWSIYRHAFGGAGNGFAYDPSDIARFMVLHRDLMAHWHQVCPGRIFELDYGELVSDPETATRALAAATGLNWSSDWLTPERGQTQVLTASADQVRQPIYRGSDEGWKRYQAQLAPLTEALRAAGVI